MTANLKDLGPPRTAGKGAFPGKASIRALTVKLGILLGGFVVVILLLAFFFAQPSATKGKFPGRFSDDERKEISSLIRRDVYLQSVRSLGHGEFRQAWRWMVNARKQEVIAVGNQPDGQIWIHVGVVDQSQPEGYYLTVRYFMMKQNGHWRITTLF